MLQIKYKIRFFNLFDGKLNSGMHLVNEFPLHNNNRDYGVCF